MNILVVDRFNSRRDPAQMDIYNAIAERHHVTLYSNGVVEDHLDSADLLYLGIYHQVLPVNYESLFRKVKCPVLIDQADNEDFIRRFATIPYGLIPRKVFLSRYLPHKGLESVVSAKQLSWYVSPERVGFGGVEKSIDVSFICSIYRQRTSYADAVRNICARNGWSCFVGQAWGEDYLNILKKTKVFVAECGRKCYTQKYTEAILCGCTIVGDRPLYPENHIQMIEAAFPSVEKGIREALERPVYSTPEFTDKDRFFREIDGILASL